VERVRCFRGLDTLSAPVLCLEVGGFAPFRSPRELAAWLGLVPTPAQSGESASQGGITKTGSRCAHRILVEAAWHYARPPRLGVTLPPPPAGPAAHVLQIAWRCQHRLYRLHRLLPARRKPGNVVTVALARSLACFLPLGGRRGPIAVIAPAARGGGAGPGQPARALDGAAHRATHAPRQAHAGGDEQGHGVTKPRISD
jgi:hypothetical protein